MAGKSASATILYCAALSALSALSEDNCMSWGFHSSVVGDSIFLAYTAASHKNQFLTLNESSPFIFKGPEVF